MDQHDSRTTPRPRVVTPQASIVLPGEGRVIEDRALAHDGEGIRGADAGHSGPR